MEIFVKNIIYLLLLFFNVPRRIIYFLFVHGRVNVNQRFHSIVLIYVIEFRVRCGPKVGATQIAIAPGGKV